MEAEEAAAASAIDAELDATEKKQEKSKTDIVAEKKVGRALHPAGIVVSTVCQR
jgi:hypothetical protein